MVILIDGVRYRLVKPENEADLENSISENHKHIFGSNSFYFDTKKKLKSPAGIGSIPDGYVILFDPKPKWAIVEVELANHPLYDHIIPQLTKFNRGMQDSSSRRKIIDTLYKTITSD